MENQQLNDKHLRSAYSRWIYDPEDWARKVLGLKIITAQQSDYFRQLGLMVRAKHYKSENIPLTTELEKYAIKSGISIRAGKGRGKDTAGAVTILWLLDCWPQVKIPCVAPGEKQLKTVVWAECNKWLWNMSGDGSYTCVVRNQYIVRGEYIRRKAAEGTLGFAFQKTAVAKRDEDVEEKTMSGFHEKVMCILVTEADGVDDQILMALESTLTSPVNFMVLLYNPTRRTGLAFRSQDDPKESRNWVRLHWDDSPNEIVSPEYIQKKKEQYGEDSNYYRVYVAGEFPQAQSDAILSWDKIQAAVNREVQYLKYPTILSVDPSGDGKDDQMICIRQGPKVLLFKKASNPRGEDNGGDEILSLVQEHNVWEVIILKNGVGIGLYRYLKARLPRVRGFYEQEPSSKPEEYINRRAELWHKAEEIFKEGFISIPDDADFMFELNEAKWIPERRKRQVIDKKTMKKNLKYSPGRADSFIASLIRSLDFLTPDEDPDYNKIDRKNFHTKEFRGRPKGWMGA